MTIESIRRYVDIFFRKYDTDFSHFLNLLEEIMDRVAYVYINANISGEPDRAKVTVHSIKDKHCQFIIYFRITKSNTMNFDFKYMDGKPEKNDMPVDHPDSVELIRDLLESTVWTTEYYCEGKMVSEVYTYLSNQRDDGEVIEQEVVHRKTMFWSKLEEMEGRTFDPWIAQEKK